MSNSSTPKGIIPNYFSFTISSMKDSKEISSHEVSD
jgi:hypothetical protein